MTSIADYSLSLAAIAIPILYSIFFEGTSILTRKKNNIVHDLLNQFNVASNPSFYFIFSLSLALPIIILSWFDFNHLSSNFADFYIPSIAVVIAGVLLSLFRSLWVLFITSVGIFILFHTFYIFHQYERAMIVIYVVFLVLYFLFTYMSSKFPNKLSPIRKFQWVPEVAGFSAFSFQLIYLIFVMGLDSIPEGGAYSNLVLANLSILFIAGWSALFAISLSLGFRWELTSVRTSLLSILIRSKPEDFKVSIKSEGADEMKDVNIKSIDRSLILQDKRNGDTIVPWEFVQRITCDSKRGNVQRKTR